MCGYRFEEYTTCMRCQRKFAVSHHAYACTPPLRVNARNASANSGGTGTGSAGTSRGLCPTPTLRDLPPLLHFVAACDTCRAEVELEKQIERLREERERWLKQQQQQQQGQKAEKAVVHNTAPAAPEMTPLTSKTKPLYWDDKKMGWAKFW